MRIPIWLVFAIMAVILSGVAAFGFCDNFAVFSPSLDSVFRYPYGLVIAVMAVVAACCSFVVTVELSDK